MLLVPLLVYFLAQVGAEFVVDLSIDEDSFGQGFEDIDEVNLSLNVRVDFYLQASEQIQGIDLFHYDTFFHIHKIPILLSEGLLS